MPSLQMSYKSHLHNNINLRISDPGDTDIIKADRRDCKPAWRTNTCVKNIGNLVRIKRITNR